MRLGAWSLALALLSVNAACGGYRPAPERPSGRPLAPEPVAGTPLTRVWTQRVVRGPSSPVAVGDGAIYIGGADRRVVAVDLASGRTRWAVRLSGPLVGGVARSAERLFAATDRPAGKVHAFSLTSGNQLWSVKTGYIHAPLALAGDLVVAINRQGQVIALEQKSGAIRWRRRVGAARIAPEPLEGERLLVTGYDSLFVLGTTDGRVLSRRAAPGQMLAPWVVDGEELVTTTGDSLVVAIDRVTLEDRWRVRLDAPLIAPPAIAGDTVYGVTRLGALFRIVRGPERVVTRLTDASWPATGTPARIGDWLLVGGADGALRAFTLGGEEAWRVRLGRPFELPAVALEGGDFLALGGRGDLTRMTR